MHRNICTGNTLVLYDTGAIDNLSIEIHKKYLYGRWCHTWSSIPGNHKKQRTQTAYYKKSHKQTKPTALSFKLK